MTTKYEAYFKRGGSGNAVFVLLALSAALLFALLTLVSVLATQARAQEGEGQRAVGPVNPDNGFPFWYQDDTGLRLDLCLDSQGCGELEGIDGTQPISFPDNFPGEAVYWASETGIDGIGPGANGNSRLVMAVEGGFANESETAAEGEQVVSAAVLGRARELRPNTEYTITHPYGQLDATTDGGGELRFEEGAGCEAPEEGEPGFGEPFNCDFSLALQSDVFNQFLTWDSFGTDRPDAPPAGQIGNPNVEHPVTGSLIADPDHPSGFQNYFRIEGPDAGGPGVDVAQTDNFVVIGKLAELTAVASPRGGEFDEPQNVTLTASEDAAQIFYTLDDSDPRDENNANRVEYDGNPINIDQTSTLRYVVANEAGEQSEVFEQQYVIVLPTELGLNADPATLDFGQSTTLSGQLTSESENGAPQPVANQQINLIQRTLNEDSFSPVEGGQLTTDEQGNFSIEEVQPEKNTIYRATFGGEEEELGASASAPLRVNVSADILLNVGRDEIVAGQRIAMGGIVSPNKAGSPVEVVIRQAGEVVARESVTLDENSRYKFVYRAENPGNYVVRAVVRGDQDNLGKISNVEKFRATR